MQEQNDQQISPISKSSKKKTVVIWILLVIVVLVIVAAITFNLTMQQEDRNVASPLVGDNKESSESVEGEQEEASPIKETGRLFIEPDTIDASVGETFTVAIKVDTGEKNTVVASALLTWNPSILEVDEVDKDNSVYSMSVVSQESDGKLEVARGAPGDRDSDDTDDGFTGTGELVSVTFKALKKGTVEINFDKKSSRLILDDGKGRGMGVELSGVVVKVD